jgi:hypothetical protein
MLIRKYLLLRDIFVAMLGGRRFSTPQGEAMNYYTLPNFNGDDYDEDDRAPMTADQQASHNQRMVEETAIIQQSPVEVAGLTW